MVWRILGSLVGLILIVVGIPLMVSPIPLGILLIFAGFIILMGSNPLVAKWVRNWRKHSKPVDDFFHKAEEVLPGEISKPLKDPQSDPDDDENDNDEEPGENDQRSARGQPVLKRRDIPRRLR